MSEPTSQKPYLIRALFEWCVDNGFTPYLSVMVDEHTRVPTEHVRNGEIVLNVGPLAANKLRMGNDIIEFAARFGGVARELRVPISCVSAIYARENGIGMSFDLDKKEKGDAALAAIDSGATLPRPPESPAPAAKPFPRPAVVQDSQDSDPPPPAPSAPPAGRRPSLRRIK